MLMKLGVLMNPIQKIQIEKDTTFAILLEAQKRAHEIFYLEQSDIFLRATDVYALAARLTVFDDSKKWYQLQKRETILLSDLDVVLMRLDPPVDINYIYTTYLLERAEQAGVLVVNKPQSLRDCNEKLLAQQFSEFCLPTVVSNNFFVIEDFLKTQKDIVLKPLDNMGGTDIFRIQEDDENFMVVVDALTGNEAPRAQARGMLRDPSSLYELRRVVRQNTREIRRSQINLRANSKLGSPKSPSICSGISAKADNKKFIIVQKFLPEVRAGDKRIIMIDGEPVPHAVLRIPAENEIRANLAAGGTAVPAELTENDYRICHAVGPMLKDKGILLAGLDVIGNYLTEINITSPTCLRQIDKFFDVNLEAQLLDVIEKKLKC